MRHWVDHEYELLVCGRTGQACVDPDCGCDREVMTVVPIERVRELESARDRQVEQIRRLQTQVYGRASSAL